MAKKRKKDASPYDIFQWFLHEFGFATLMLLFSFGALGVGISITQSRSANQLDNLSNYVSAQQELCDLPAVPSGLQVSKGAMQGEIDVLWDSQASFNYSLLVTDTFNEESDLVSYDAGEASSYTITDLVPGRTYAIQLAAITSCGLGEFTDPITMEASTRNSAEIDQTPVVASTASANETDSSESIISEDLFPRETYNRMLELQAYLQQSSFWTLTLSLIALGIAALIGLKLTGKRK